MFSSTKTLFTASLLETTNSKIQDARRTQVDIPYAQGSCERIREMFKKVDLSVSSYDTAWVAKIPSPNSPKQPCFPECLNWLLENQLPNGSWPLPVHSELLRKDSLMCTLASILALKQWEVGEMHVRKGIIYMESNIGLINEKKQLTPVGFNIIFPNMFEASKRLDLNLNLNGKLVDEMLHNRDLEYERMSKCNSKIGKSYIASISEGLYDLYDCKEIKKYQRKNGSVADSPSATAALLIRSPDDAKGLEYLRSLLDIFGSAVPTIHPTNMYIPLCLVDRLEGLGINRHFLTEIKDVLDKTYRCWLERDDGIFFDMETCALAFRLLQTNGYEISSDALTEFEKKEYPYNGPSQNLKDINCVLELYKSSEIMTSGDELVLENIQSWTREYLLKELSRSTTSQDRKCYNKVDHTLKLSYSDSVLRLETRKNIESYKADDIHMLKTSYRCSNINNKDLLCLAAKDYNFCQAIHQRELNNLEGWATENGIDKLEFARQRETVAYFMIATILPSPKLSDERMTWSKYAILVTVIDDFIDLRGCRGELVNLIELVQKWENPSVCYYYSEPVKIIFLALYKATNELGDTAFNLQGRSVTTHLIDLWVALLEAMLREHDQEKDDSAPTLQEYMEYGHVSIGVKLIVLSMFYLMGDNISQEIIVSPEYNILARMAASSCRLLNDLQSFKREAEQGKQNSVQLCMIHGRGSVITEQEAIRQVQSIISFNNREILAIVLKTKGSVLPRNCKDLLWNVKRVISYLYNGTDGFSFPQRMAADMKTVLYTPVDVCP